jgi:hypothetical protein
MAMRGWFVFGVIIFAFWAYTDYSKQQRKEKREAREVACQANPACRDAKANREAKFQSIIRDSPVLSSTGAVYFKGKPCLGDCAGYIAGYQWAEEEGISEDDDCAGHSQSFIDGCSQYVSEQLEKLEGTDSESSYDDQRSCTPGRYGDC